LILGFASEIEITGNDPGSVVIGFMGGKILEEDNLIGLIARGINVSKAQSRTICVEGEINSKNIPR
jgi:hypothetical protein